MRMPRALSKDWKTIKALYVSGATYAELAEAYGVAESTIRVRSSRQGWTKLRPSITDDAALGKIWDIRREKVKEGEFKIAERIMDHAAQMPPDQLVAKADKVKIGVDLGRRSVGLDRDEDKNMVNIALLGAIPSATETYNVESRQMSWSELGRNTLDNSVEHTDSQSVDHHPTHHGPL